MTSPLHFIYYQCPNFFFQRVSTIPHETLDINLIEIDRNRPRIIKEVAIKTNKFKFSLGEGLWR